MPERRQAHRREHIEVEVRDRVLEAHPLPWLQRNDLGNELITQYTEIFNSALKAFVDPETNIPAVESALNDRLSNPIKIIQIGYPDADEEFLLILEWAELRDLIYATLDSNELSDLKPLVDPNFPTQTANGGTSGLGGLQRIRDTLKLQSIPDSSSPESDETNLSSSPTEKSPSSSNSPSEESGKTDSGSTP